MKVGKLKYLSEKKLCKSEQRELDDVCHTWKTDNC